MASGAQNPPNGEKQKNAPANGRKRIALKDIGNVGKNSILVVEGKLEPQISRPMTRSFYAKLLANGKANTSTTQVVDGVVAINGFAATKDRPEAKARKKVSKASPNRASVVTSSRESSSVLNAQRKMAAVQLTERPRIPIINIDADDVNDELAQVEYVNDIYQFYKLGEDENRAIDYMNLQRDITSWMRATLMDWLVDVHWEFKLVPGTLFLTINIIDRYLSTKIVHRRELQLVGITSMLIASKYEEVWAPLMADFIHISANTYSTEQVLKMEKSILTNLEWYLTVPTPYVFLVRFLKASVAPDKEMEDMVFFLTELGLMNYSMISFSPSMIAASAVYAARCTLRKVPIWTATLKHYTGYTEDQLRDCAKLLVSFHSGAAENKLKAVYRKYSKLVKGAVALVPPAEDIGGRLRMV